MSGEKRISHNQQQTYWAPTGAGMMSVKGRADICQARIELSEGNGGRQQHFLARLPVQGPQHVVLVRVLQGLLRNLLFTKVKCKGRSQAPASSSSLIPYPAAGSSSTGTQVWRSTAAVTLR
ncbi:hypothetical protein QMK33_21740 [Hymenobacter sp. H14-R3]|uniref:hypothetical protein n=1 Tax=Hymenobacter sp. H14-R3 TaxID=3046308 RepID=UPI0024BB7F17|nr:hypothetical protein [Hymenobacter sp. H14-R3]MDJ0367777.1 hypothetical protein [Hymenobacter sp. H14-R3]